MSHAKIIRQCGVDIKTKFQYLGQRVNIVIQPLDAGVVHARANRCSVAQTGVVDKGFTIFGKNNYCRNRFIDFQVGENYGGTGTQKYSYTVMIYFFFLKNKKE